MARILIVDDEPLNRELLLAYLEGDGHDLCEAESGEAALAMARQQVFDLVLLDVLMTGMSGFEVAQELKIIFAGQFVPVILVTALSDQAAKLKGLGCGADEFLTKPIDQTELLVRVNHLLARRTSEQTLLQKNIDQVELHRFKDEVSAMIVHDLRNPLSAVVGNIEYVLTDSAILHAGQEDALREALAAGKRAARLIENMLDVTRIEARRFQLRREPTPIGPLLSQVLNQYSLYVRSKELHVSSDVPEHMHIEMDVDLMMRVVENILENSIRYTPIGGKIQIWAELSPSLATLRIANSGPPIPIDHRTAIFEKFGQVTSETGRRHLGLGLYFCRLALEAHGGRIWVEETATMPTVFGLELPPDRREVHLV